MKDLDEKGFTFIEVMVAVVICVLVVFVLFYGTLGKGNFWFTREGVLREIQVDDPDVVRVVRVNRNILRFSEIEVENKEGVRSVYRLDTNVLFNYGLELK